MIILIKKVMKDWMTENDGVSYCAGRAIGLAAGITMLYKFVVAASPDYISFGGGISAIIAAIALKNKSEQPGKAEPS